MNNLERSTILVAIKTVPKVFSLLKKCDKTYLIIMLLEVLAFSIEKYPTLLIMKYTIDALTKNIAYTTYFWNIIPMIAIMLLIKMFRVYINTSRPIRDQVVTEKLFNAFFNQCMKVDYQTLESKEMQDKKELAKYIANGKIAAVGWYFVEMFSSLIALLIATVFLFQISPIILLIVVVDLIIKAVISKKVLDKKMPISKKQIMGNRFLNYLYSYFTASIAHKINGQVLVGDFLLCEEVCDQLYAYEIIRRKNTVSRRLSGKTQGLVANVDIVFIVTSANQDFNLARLERYYIIAKESKAKICFVLSKIDLLENYDELVATIANRFPHCFIEKTSIESGEVTLFSHWNKDESAVFLGSSGVGKSSLINYMLRESVIKTKNIREGDGRGRHTTTARHMYILPDNRIVIDTPGLRSVGISAKADTIDELFPKIKELKTKCKYSDCSHQKESGCAICQALDNNELDYEGYLRYLKLVGAEKQREILQDGKAYQKEQMCHELKVKGKKGRGH